LENDMWIINPFITDHLKQANLGVWGFLGRFAWIFGV